MSFYQWRSQIFDYQYDVKTGKVMRYIAGTRKGVLACELPVGIKSAQEARKQYFDKYEQFAK